ENLKMPAVALPFARMFDRRTGEARFKDRYDLSCRFRIDENAAVVLSGTDVDSPLESWWSLGRERRKRIIQSLKELRIDIVTSPNYSLFIDQPRWDDLHSMKRIAIVQSEFLNGGLQAALHVNGRTELDFQRWADYVRQRPEIQIIAYEFAT